MFFTGPALQVVCPASTRRCICLRHLCNGEMHCSCILTQMLDQSHCTLVWHSRSFSGMLAEFAGGGQDSMCSHKEHTIACKQLTIVGMLAGTGAMTPSMHTSASNDKLTGIDSMLTCTKTSEHFTRHMTRSLQIFSAKTLLSTVGPVASFPVS